MRFGEPGPLTIEEQLPSLKYYTVNGANAPSGDFLNLLEVSNSGGLVMKSGQCKKVVRVNASNLWNEVEKATPDFTDEFDTSNYCTSFFIKKDNFRKYFGPFAGRAFLRSN